MQGACMAVLCIQGFRYGWTHRSGAGVASANACADAGAAASEPAPEPPTVADPGANAHAGTDAALFAELESAYQRKAPIVLWIYSPHWAPAKYEGSFVEFPAYTPECYDDPAWGSNPDMAYDCGKPTGPIWKVAWSGLAETWPGAAKAVEAFTISNEDMGAMVGEVDLNGKSVDEVSDAWLEANKDTWSAWIAD